MEAYLLIRWQPVYRRHELDTGFSTERGNLTFDAKGNDKWRATTRKNTDAKGRGGAVRSSDEAFVMNVERRGSVIWLTTWVNLRKQGGANGINKIV